MLEFLVRLFAPWQTAYSGSKVLATIVTGLHLLSMLVGGGFAIAADRMTLRLAQDEPAVRARHLVELRDLHLPVTFSLVVLFVTGVALTAADIETFTKSPVFWIKLALVVALVYNGYVLWQNEGALRDTGGELETPKAQHHWHMLVVTAIASLVLWIATLVVGVVLVNAA